MKRAPTKRASVSNLANTTTEDARTGAVRSLQAADVSIAPRDLAEIWSPMYLERLARTYWRFLSKVTVGLVRVQYTESKRLLVLVAKPFNLFTFLAPEYEIDAQHGVVRWRIDGGLLVVKGAGEGSGHLEIRVRKLPDTTGAASACARLHIEVEVANFHPAIASKLGRRFYNLTQSKVHVLVTHGFLRSLSKLKLAESKVGQLAE